MSGACLRARLHVTTHTHTQSYCVFIVGKAMIQWSLFLVFCVQGRLWVTCNLHFKSIFRFKSSLRECFCTSMQLKAAFRFFNFLQREELHLMLTLTCEFLGASQLEQHDIVQLFCSSSWARSQLLHWTFWMTMGRALCTSPASWVTIMLSAPFWLSMPSVISWGCRGILSTLPWNTVRRGEFAHSTGIEALESNFNWYRNYMVSEGSRQNNPVGVEKTWTYTKHLLVMSRTRTYMSMFHQLLPNNMFFWSWAMTVPYYFWGLKVSVIGCYKCLPFFWT